MVSRSLRASLRDSPRAAIVELAEQLAGEIDAAELHRDRLPLVRAFLACVAQLEALDAAARRQAKEDAENGAQEASQPSALDELLSRRAAKRERSG